MRDKIQVARLAIHDILDMIDNLRTVLHGLTFESFAASAMHRFAAERMIEIVSEASRRISDDLKATEQSIPWPQIAGIGNILRHDYDDVRPRAIWNVVRNDLDSLEAALRRMLAKIGAE
jgi:uncharacterized protein with HEPN domain